MQQYCHPFFVKGKNEIWFLKVFFLYMEEEKFFEQITTAAGLKMSVYFFVQDSFVYFDWYDPTGARY